MKKNKLFKAKFIITLGAVLVGLAAIPFIITAADEDVPTLTIEPMAQVLDIQPLVEIAPAAGETLETDEPEEVLIVAENIEQVSKTAPEVEIAPEVQSVEGEEDEGVDYNTVLSFPITQDKLRAFVMAAHKIDQVNRKWDMLISSAETDTMAVEFMTLSAGEMDETMTSITDITVAEYNEIFKYSTQNRDFKKIIAAFKQYYVDGPRENRN